MEDTNLLSNHIRKTILKKLNLSTSNKHFKLKDTFHIGLDKDSKHIFYSNSIYF